MSDGWLGIENQLSGGNGMRRRRRRRTNQILVAFLLRLANGTSASAATCDY